MVSVNQIEELLLAAETEDGWIKNLVVQFMWRWRMAMEREKLAAARGTDTNPDDF